MMAQVSTAEPLGMLRGLKQMEEVTLYTPIILQYYSECCLHYARTDWLGAPHKWVFAQDQEKAT